MNRDILLYRLCPMHRIYDCCNSDTNFHCVDCTRVMNEWLDGYDNQIRADAIDEFAKRLKAKCRKCYVDCDPYGSGIEEDSILYEDDIDEIAEELKEQDK